MPPFRPPISTPACFSALEFFADAQTPLAHATARRAINLPSYHDMTEADIGRVCDVIGQLLNG